MTAPPPRRPASHPGASFRLKVSQLSPICQALEFVGVEVGTLNLGELELELSDVINDFIDARFVAQDQFSFRKEMKAFKTAISEFKSCIPDAVSPLSAALVKHWNQQTRARAEAGYTDPRGLEPARMLLFLFHDPNAFSVMKESLSRLNDALDDLEIEEGVGAKGPASARADHEMTLALANIYERLTGKRPTHGTDPLGEDQRERASGPFSSFVKAVEDELVQQRAAEFMTKKLLGDSHDSRRNATHAEAFALAGQLRLIRHSQSHSIYRQKAKCRKIGRLIPLSSPISARHHPQVAKMSAALRKRMHPKWKPPSLLAGGGTVARPPLPTSKNVTISIVRLAPWRSLPLSAAVRRWSTAAASPCTRKTASTTTL